MAEYNKGLFDNIIRYFKQVFGVKPEDKDVLEIASDFYSKGMSITDALAKRLTNLTLSDNSINIIGDSERAKRIERYIEWVNNAKLNAISEVCLGTGECLARPTTDGKNIGVEIIPNENYVIVNSMGDVLNSVVIKCDEMRKDRHIYERWEYHHLGVDELGTPYCAIEQLAFMDNKRIALADVDAWAGLKDATYVPNVDKLLFGRFKSVVANRNDVNSNVGVPITFGADYVIDEIKKSYARFNDEFEKSEKMLFADKRVFKTERRRDANGNLVEKNVLPKGKERVILSVNGSNSVDGEPLIKEFNPQIRDANLENGIQVNLRMLELLVGLDTGILSKSDINYTNLDETRKSVQNTFAFITRYRKALESGLNDLIYAVNVICNANNITPIGTYEVDYDWSDSYAESMVERFNELLQAYSVGAISQAEMRAWVMDENLDLAKEELEAIRKEIVLVD